MRLLTFLSDFGGDSPYPASMKAVAAGICDARFVDITHAVPRHSVRTGAYLLWSVAPACPPGTVHCAVVDPGVGSARAPLAIAAGEQVFVGPDNGLLLPAAKRLGHPTVYRLTNPAFWHHPVSATFHGRDIFAPVAAHLAAGVALEALGAPAPDYADISLEEGGWDGSVLRGTVLWVDPFGNLITTIPAALLAGLAGAQRVELVVAARTRVAAIGHTFADVSAGEAVIVRGSDGLVEIALNQGRAADAFAASAGDPVWLRAADIGS